MLVVEDDAVNLLVVSNMLEVLGHVSIGVNNGKEALATLGQACQMPELDGYETTRAIRRQEAGAPGRIPVVALTANVVAGEREKCLDAGMDDFLTKPLRKQELSEILNRWLPVPSS